ncbi:MAG TPA: peptidylprolyl isomerase [Gammaproteobacteria bacterium]|nr:peptidylprolyl isomerase [Gammaproteobacteria bacterium]
MTDELTIQSGSVVSIFYTITLNDGTVADSNFGEQPLDFVMGDGTLIEVLELALYGLKQGDKQDVGIDPMYAFGLPDEEAIQDLPRSDFPDTLPLEPGLIMAFATPEGEDIPASILEVGEDTVKVDFNHPLAGHEIRFVVEVVTVKPSQA